MARVRVLRRDARSPGRHETERRAGPGRAHAAPGPGIAPACRGDPGARHPRPPAGRRRARASGSSGPSSPARPPRASTGAARPATTGSTCASANGRPPTTSGSGSTARPPWASPRTWPRPPRSSAPSSSAFALADALVEGGERTGLLGLTRATASRQIVETMAQAIVADRGRPGRGCSAPRLAGPLRRGHPDQRLPVAARRDRQGRRGPSRRPRRPGPPRDDRRPGRGDLPLHRARPFCTISSDSLSLEVGDAGAWGEAYRERIAAHRGAARGDRAPPGLDPDDPSHRPPGERGGPSPPDPRRRLARRPAEESPHARIAPHLRRSPGPRRPRRPAGPLVPPAGDAAAAAAHRFPAPADHGRPAAQAGDPGPHAALAADPAHPGRRLPHPRGLRAGLEPVRRAARGPGRTPLLVMSTTGSAPPTTGATACALATDAIEAAARDGRAVAVVGHWPSRPPPSRPQVPAAALERLRSYRATSAPAPIASRISPPSRAFLERTARARRSSGSATASRGADGQDLHQGPRRPRRPKAVRSPS